MAGQLRAGHTDYAINDAALDYMREHARRRFRGGRLWPERWSSDWHA